MSTRLVTEEDYKFFDFLAPYRWPNQSKSLIANYRQLVETGEIQIETLVENALAQASQGLYTRVCEDSYDFCDGSEAKKSVSCFRQNDYSRGQWTNSFAITNLKNKTGLIRAVCYSKQQDQFYFFAIPFAAYQGMSRIDIVLDTFSGYEGDPKGIPRGKWTRFQVDSFEQLAQLKPREARRVPYNGIF